MSALPAAPAPAGHPPADQLHLHWLARAPGERSAGGLRQVLAGYLGDTALDARIDVGAHGRPELAPPHAALRFSLSHCGPWLLVAVAVGVQPGVDLEATRPRPNAARLARRYFDADEAAELLALPAAARELRFYQGWTAREAVLKAVGRGLAFGLGRLRIGVDADGALRLRRLAGDDPAAWQLQALSAPAGHLAALAWRGPPRTVEVFDHADAIDGVLPRAIQR
jgi:4'-phosphopantetheinyl transferase